MPGELIQKTKIKTIRDRIYECRRTVTMRRGETGIHAALRPLLPPLLPYSKNFLSTIGRFAVGLSCILRVFPFADWKTSLILL